MIGVRISSYGACVRCVHSAADGTVCTAAALRRPAAPTAEVRRPGGGCGPDAVWHVYRPAPAGAAPLVQV